MQNNIFNKINVSSRLLVLLLLTFSLMLTNSICFILMFSILGLILLILSNESVKCYIDLLKNLKFMLLFVFLAYIIMLGNIFNALLILYKINLIILFIKLFMSTIKFQTLTNGIKTLFKPLKHKFKIDNISLNISLFIYFLNYYISSKQKILSKYSVQNFNFSLKNNILPRLILTTHKLKKLESDLKLKHYSPKFEVSDRKSNIVVVIFTILLTIVVFKEVIS